MSDAWTLRVTASGRQRARVTTRGLQFTVGKPMDFDPQAAAVSALECALGALGAEIVGGLQAFAERRRLALDEVEALVRAEVAAPLVYLEVVGETGQPRLTEIDVRVYVSSPEDATALRRAFDDALAALPLVGTLRQASHLEIELIVTT